MGSGGQRQQGKAAGRAGVRSVLGWLVGRVRARWVKRRARLGWLGREAEQAEAACEASLFFSFSILFFFFFVLNSNFV